MKLKLILTLAITMFSINSFSVVMPKADARNAYKFKKDYEDGFKDRNPKNAAKKNKVKAERAGILEIDEQDSETEISENHNHRRDEKTNDTTLANFVAGGPENSIAGNGPGTNTGSGGTGGGGTGGGGTGGGGTGGGGTGGGGTGGGGTGGGGTGGGGTGAATQGNSNGNANEGSNPNGNSLDNPSNGGTPPGKKP